MPCGHNEALSDNEKTVGSRIIALKEITMLTDIKEQVNHSKRTIAISLTALIAVLVLTIAIHDTVSASVMQPDGGIDLSGQFGSGTPEGVWSDGSTIWVVDNDNRKLVAYDRSTGGYLADKTIQLDSANGEPRGIWSTASTIWVSDWDDTKLYAYGLGTGIRQANLDIDLASRNDAPRGITGLYNTIWVVDKDDTWVYAYSLNGGGRLEDAEFDLNSSNDHPWGIWASDSQIWVSDLDDDSLYAYDFSSGAHDPSRDLRLPLDNRDPRGIWADGETMWIVDDDDKRTYAIYYRHFRHNDDEIDISAVNDPAGIWTDGDTMWVVDAGATPARKLLAYSLSDGARDATKDTVLSSDNQHPGDIWSDGDHVWVLDTQDDFVYAYVLGSDDGVKLDDKSFEFPHFMDGAEGICVDDSVMFVAEPSITLLYAYSVSLGNHQLGWTIKLDSENTDARGVWCDGETIWVLDTADAHVYAYELNYQDSDFSTGTVYRKKSLEFRPSPHNRGHGAGFTGHGARFWVADADDDLLYAYGGLNTPPAFPQTTVEFLIHETTDAGSMVGTVPDATDEDGDQLTYWASGPIAGHFTVREKTGRILVGDSPPNFQNGNEYSFTVYVSDGKSRLDGEDDRADDAIRVTIRVMENANPKFNIDDGKIFTVDEDHKSGRKINKVLVNDRDGDDLTYDVNFQGPGHGTPPFFMGGKLLKLKSDETLDYERRNSYDLVIRVKDNKDDQGEPDDGWDDSVKVTVQVNNVDEPGAVALSSAQPVVDVEIVATPTDPDYVIADEDTHIDWTVERGADPESGPWTEVLAQQEFDYSLEYTPAEADVGHYLRFTASYLDYHVTDSRKTAQVVTAHAVVASQSTNRPPTFDEGSVTSRDVPEDAAMLTAVGDPVTATDQDDATLDYELASATTNRFGVSSGPSTMWDPGQIVLVNNFRLDHELVDTHQLRIRVRDKKDADGNPDTGWDATIIVNINITNVEEAGVVSFSSDSPEENVPLSASLTDPDGEVANVSWQWQRADSETADTWATITDATSDGYVPSLSDVGKFLRAEASYDDGEGTGKTAGAVTASAVVTASNDPPEFDEGMTASRSVAEGASVGTPVGAAVTATDPDGDELSYSLAAGGGSGLFAIDPLSGKITVAAGQSLDYETNPSYALTVQVSDGKDSSHIAEDTFTIDNTITVTVNLINVDEPGRVTLDTAEPEVGTAIVATLKDPDGSLGSQEWQWSRSSDGSTNWADIAGATADSHTPTTDDGGMYLRASVGYTDGEGSGKSANAATSRPVPVSAPGRSGSPGGGSGQQTPPNPELDFYERCVRDERAGTVANCGMNDLASYRVELDGSYTINWEEWDAANPDVTGYTILINEFVYKQYYVGSAEVSDEDLAHVYESCAFVDDRWNCQGKLTSNYFQDMNGNPTQVRVVALNVDQTELTHALDKPGRWMSDQTYHRWSGDATDPNNEPTEVAYRRMKFEMDLYHFQVHGGSGGRGAVLVEGANGFGEHSE